MVKKNLFYFFAGLSLILIYLIFLNPYLDVRGFNADDPASYINRAVSLWKGIGYGEQFADVFLPVTGQPFVFSLMIAPVVGWFGVNFLMLKLFMVFLAILLSVSLYYFFKYFLEENDQAHLFTLLMMASPVIFGLSHRVLADIPLFLFVILALKALNCYLREPSPVISSDLFLSSLLLGISYLIKASAIGVWFGGWFLILHPRFRSKIVFQKLIAYTIIGFIPILMWYAWCRTVPQNLWYWTVGFKLDFIDPNSHSLQGPLISLSDLFLRMRHNIVWGMSNNIAVIFFAPFYFTESYLIGFLLGLPIAFWLFLEWIRSYLKNPSVLEGFVVFSLALLLIKYLGHAARYIALVYPAFLVYAGRGMKGFSKSKQVLLVSGLFLVSICTTVFVAIDQAQTPYGSATLKNFVMTAQKAKEIFPSDSKCFVPLMSHWQIMTGHQCFFSPQKFLENLKSNTSTYLVGLSDKGPKDLESFQDLDRHVLKDAVQFRGIAESMPQAFQKVYENDTFAIYKVINQGNMA